MPPNEVSPAVGGSVLTNEGLQRTNSLGQLNAQDIHSIPTATAIHYSKLLPVSRKSAGVVKQASRQLLLLYTHAQMEETKYLL